MHPTRSGSSLSSRLSRLNLVLACGLSLSVGALAQADNVTCIALVGAQAPGAATGARFATVGQPTIANGGRVAFSGTLQVGTGGVTASNDAALWLWTEGGSGSILAREGANAPGMPAAVTFTEFGPPVLDSVNGAGFWARLSHTGGVTSATDQIVYQVLDGAANFVYQTGNPFFGGPEGPFATALDYRDNPAMNWNAFPVIKAVLVTGAGIPVDESIGIWGPSATGDVIQIARQGTTAPDIASAPLYDSEFTSPVISFRGDMAYRATLRRGTGDVDASNDVGIWIALRQEEVHYLLARTGNSVGHGDVSEAVYETLGTPVLTGEPRVGFRATMRIGVGGITANDDEGLFTRCPCGSTYMLVREGQDAPGTFPGTAFSHFSNPAFSQDGRVMFSATLRGANVTAANDTSVWWADAPSTFLLAAREGAPAPRGNGATFAHFDSEASGFWLATSFGNQLVFPATLSNGVRGIYVYTPGRGLSCMVQEGDSVEVAPGDVRQIVGLTPRTDGLAHDGRRTAVSFERQFAFSATVTGGQAGVFITDLPTMGMGCPSDWNNDTAINSQDFFDFITDFFAGAADLNYSGFTDSQDFFDFLTAFFSGC